MPPSLTRAATSAASAATRHSLTSTTRPHQLLHNRTFATTSRLLKIITPPESPRFIALKEPPQSSEPRLPFVKGHLPIPRRVFHLRKKDKTKIQSSYLTATARAPKPQKPSDLTTGNDAPRAAWQRRTAAARRVALRTGLKGLWDRKLRDQNLRQRRARARARVIRAARAAPERPDVVFTRGTIPEALLRTSRVVPPPNQAELLRASRERTAAVQQARKEARREALSELYIAAREFIVTEKQLEQRINENFKENSFVGSGIDLNAKSRWGQGAPLRLSEMVAEQTNHSKSLYQKWANEAGARIAQQRLKRVSGKLTGGKMAGG